MSGRGQNNRCVNFHKRPKSVCWRDIKNSKSENDLTFGLTTYLSTEKLMLILNMNIASALPSKSTQKIFKIWQNCEKSEFLTTYERNQKLIACHCFLLAETILFVFSGENWVDPYRFDTHLLLLGIWTNWTKRSLQHDECSHLANLATLSFRKRFSTFAHHSNHQQRLNRTKHEFSQ